METKRKGVIIPINLIGTKNSVILNVFLPLCFLTHKQMIKLKKEKTIDDLMYNINYAVYQLKKTLRKRDQWEKIMNQKKKNERTNI